jgi:L-proline---[L-prolyl-carrier protein] ligase
VVWGETVLTYGDLDAQSNRVATLLEARGIGRGSRAALHLPKSPRGVVVMLGVLKAGAAYVPIDPHAPPLRAAYILRDCAVRGLITTADTLTQIRTHLAGLASLETILLTDDDGDSPAPLVRVQIKRWAELASIEAAEPKAGSSIESDPAYLLYTSGSTGNPKGVILTHRSALAFVDWGAETFGVRPDDRLSNHAPLHFDLSVFDIFVALRAGATVVMVPDQVALFPTEVARWIDDEGISIWYSVPSALTRLLLHGGLDRYHYERLRTVLFAGEVFPVKYLREVMTRFPRAAFFNLYGPTETNVCTYSRVPRPLPLDVTEISIGRACANTEVFALNTDNVSIGAGETGELYVRGPTLMAGYWGLPGKTREVLIRNPLQAAFEEDVYRTGDMVRLEPDGSYSFVGRRDDMVKSRGYRIELGEIEAVLLQHSGVREAAVLGVPDDEIGVRLKAVAALGDDAVSEEELRAFCLARLPRYMVPEAFVFRPELPKTSTGKIDRQALAGNGTPTTNR